MIPHDLHNTLEYLRVTSPDAYNNQGTTAFPSRIIDLKNYVGVEWVITTGDLTDADATYTAVVTHGDAVDDEANPATITDEAAVDDFELLGTEAEIAFDKDDDDAIFKIGYRGTKRFVRLTITPAAANSGDSDLSVVAVLKPRFAGVGN
jgi:hypothetical protein